MIVYDERGNVLDSEKLDYAKGYLAVRKRTHHHPALEAAPEEGHLETLAEYPETGGRDVRWVVDTPGADAQEAWDEEETYTEYVRYTEKELAAIAAERAKPSAEELAAMAAALAKPTAEQRAAALEKENVRLKAQVQALSDRGEFMEDCLAEMAAVVYG